MTVPWVLFVQLIVPVFSIICTWIICICIEHYLYKDYMYLYWALSVQGLYVSVLSIISKRIIYLYLVLSVQWLCTCIEYYLYKEYVHVLSITCKRIVYLYWYYLYIEYYLYKDYVRAQWWTRAETVTGCWVWREARPVPRINIYWTTMKKVNTEKGIRNNYKN